jgi:capsular exopolysaccharide synthesis family protein
LLQRLKEASVSAGMDIGNIHVTSPAAPPEVPYRPRKALSMMLALALGLTFGVGISVVLESMDNTLADPWEVEGLGLPLLGWLPTVDKVSDGGRVQIEAGSTNGSRQFLPLPTLAKESEKEVKGASESESLASECVRTLCSSLVLSQAGQPPQMISVSSAVPGEGKTTTAAAVGAALAEMNFPTLLVDADFRRPALAKRLGIDGTEGLSTFLAGGALKIQPTKTENLFILPAGPNPPNPLALMNSERGRAAWKKFRESFRFVVVDSPPVLSVADSSLLASMSDGVVLVVEAAKTPSDVVQRAIRRLEQANAPILGAAVNRVNLDRPEYSRYRRYYYGKYEQN